MIKHNKKINDENNLVRKHMPVVVKAVCCGKPVVAAVNQGTLPRCSVSSAHAMELFPNQMK